MANNSRNVIYTEEQIEQALKNLEALSQTPKPPPNTAKVVIETRLFDKIMFARAQNYSWDDILECIAPTGINMTRKSLEMIMNEAQAKQEAAAGKGASRSRAKTVNSAQKTKQDDVTVVASDNSEQAVNASFGEPQDELGFDAKVEQVIN